MCSWNTFGAHTNHGQTWTHKIHHNPNLGETTIFPLIVFFMFGHEAYTQMSFCPGIFKLGVLEFPKLRLLRFWRPTNFFPQNLWLKWGLKQNFKDVGDIEGLGQFEPLSRDFQGYMTRHLHASKLGRFLTFSGQESSWQFDSWPFFWS
jgi:hypothetical protein